MPDDVGDGDLDGFDLAIPPPLSPAASWMRVVYPVLLVNDLLQEHVAIQVVDGVLEGIRLGMEVGVGRHVVGGDAHHHALPLTAVSCVATVRSLSWISYWQGELSFSWYYLGTCLVLSVNGYDHDVFFIIMALQKCCRDVVHCMLDSLELCSRGFIYI